ncbi:SPOR domain-containing protein [Sphingomonas sp. 1P06PA]|uniref:SPOR domain-containing protein n=1 Tax=Sphingomonas sp. 1P06PA TaxID=554121 RepID=UPI0039A63C9C
MKKQIVLKFAASALVLGTVTVGCKPAGQARPLGLSSSAPKLDAQVDRLTAKAKSAIAAKRGNEAVAFAEQAVALEPRGIEPRIVLGQAYLAAGRFQSAETSFGEVLELSPSEPRAMLSRALAQIALGRKRDAIGGLDAARGVVGETDRGLGLALAGEPTRAIEILEAAVRAPDADAKARQNLALSYALAGRWREAQLMASYDVSPLEVTNRIMQWAQFAQPRDNWDQVATLLGVTPAADTGRPERLALAPVTAEPVAVAAAEPVPAAPAEPTAGIEAPAVFADAGPVAAEPAAEALPLPYAQPSAAPLIRAAAGPVKVAAVPAVYRRIIEQQPRQVSFRQQARGSFAVQVGAFSSATLAEAAWGKSQHRFARFAGLTPSHTTIKLATGTYHRLSLAGFATRDEAVQLCQRLRSAGGDCFVRGVAGDAPMRFASAKPARPATRPVRLASR